MQRTDAPPLAVLMTLLVGIQARPPDRRVGDRSVGASGAPFPALPDNIQTVAGSRVLSPAGMCSPPKRGHTPPGSQAVLSSQSLWSPISDARRPPLGCRRGPR